MMASRLCPQEQRHSVAYLYKFGKRARAGDFTVYYQEGGGGRAHIVVPQKEAGLSVLRHRIKRRLTAIAGQDQKKCWGNLLIMAKRKALTASVKTLQKEYQYCKHILHI